MVQTGIIGVVVNVVETNLSIVVHPGSGVPENQNVAGSLTELLTGDPIGGEEVELWITVGIAAPVLHGYATTYPDGSYGFFGIPVTAGTYAFEVHYRGTDIYGASSNSATAMFTKVDAALSIEIEPAIGYAPLDVTVRGVLTRVDTGAGLGGCTVNLYRNDVFLSSKKTSVDPATLGEYGIPDTLVAGVHEYYAEFEGDDLFSGCKEDTSREGEPHAGWGCEDAW